MRVFSEDVFPPAPRDPLTLRQTTLMHALLCLWLTPEEIYHVRAAYRLFRMFSSQETSSILRRLSQQVCVPLLLFVCVCVFFLLHLPLLLCLFVCFFFRVL